MKMFFTYIVRCKDGALYTGFTTDLHRRLNEHNGISSGKGAKATRMKRPVNLVYFESFSSKNEAMSREWHIKQLSKKEKEKMVENNKLMKVILASGSPRRKELLLQAGIDFEVITADIGETSDILDPAKLVEHLSQKKALKVHEANKGSIILAADTVVAIEGKILGKPKSKEDAVHMLKLLAGKTHQVFTGVTIIDKKSNVNTFYESTQVTMYDNSLEVIDAYVNTLEPMDKACAYGIQGRGAVLIKKIDGDYNNVVGLPLARVYQELLKIY